MQRLKIDLASCVRASSKYSQCTKCHDICPIDQKGILFDENIAVVQESCIDCGGCMGVCPSEAISFKGFDTIDFLFGYIKSEESLLGCQGDLPCLASLGVEHLISSAILKEGEIVFDLSHCASCEVGSLKVEAIEPMIEEANRVLGYLGVDKRIAKSEVPQEIEAEETPQEEPDRREFLKRLSPKGIIETKVAFDKELEEVDRREIIDASLSAKMKEKSYPDKRKLLYMALKRLSKPEQLERVGEELLSFVSQKSIDSSCDNCSFCYRLCSTGALSSDRRGSKIDFDALACIKCRLCHDVCQTDSIHLEDFSLESFFEPKVEKLIEFQQRRCAECGNFFTMLDPTHDLCPRCYIEEEEAKSLWGIQ